MMPHVPPTDGEKLSGVTEGRGVRAALSTHRAEDSSESREEEQVVSGAAGKNVLRRAQAPRPRTGWCVDAGVRLAGTRVAWPEFRPCGRRWCLAGWPRVRLAGMLGLSGRVAWGTVDLGLSSWRRAGQSLCCLCRAVCACVTPTCPPCLSVDPVDPGAFSLLESEGRDPNLPFPAGARKPPPLNLTHQVPPWWEEVSASRLVGLRGHAGGGLCPR